MTNAPDLSIVVPVYNEAENLAPLCEELSAALGPLAFEVVLVDDGSDDGSSRRFGELRRRHPWLRVVRHPRNAGQSAAFCTGALRARAPVIVTIDGDLQNDPADIPRLFAIHREASAAGGVWLVAGRRRRRCDPLLRRLASAVANRVRSTLLGDQCPDTGCSLKVFPRDAFLLLPQFDHMHRFLPALFARDGASIVNVDVNHRPRAAGVSKYDIGNRLWVGLFDLLGARWLLARRFRLDAAARLALREECFDE